MAELDARALEARTLAQERILDALLRALALEQPALLGRVRSILIDTEFTHVGRPGLEDTLHEQIQSRIAAAERFADDHGGPSG